MPNDSTAKTPIATGKVTVVGGLSEQQFATLQRTFVYGLAVFGFLAGGQRPTPDKKNLGSLKTYADAVLGLVNDGE